MANYKLIVIADASSNHSGCLSKSVLQLYETFYNYKDLYPSEYDITSYTDLIKVINELTPACKKIISFKIDFNLPQINNSIIPSFPITDINFINLPITQLDYQVFHYLISLEIKNLFYHNFIRKYSHDHEQDLVNSQIGLLKCCCDNFNILNPLELDKIKSESVVILGILLNEFKYDNSGTEYLQLSEEIAYYRVIIEHLITLINSLSNNSEKLLCDSVSEHIKIIFELISRYSL